ncbi:ABC transporter permease [Notoacmeibacter sp. MSK16QG-6]|uniref:ABC transporter permease n=1 Tax=Notoacmeibacter sp. MSK16QG-6 TaxID=2957982 RepID=UPI00209E6F3B|nr:ABC transporter permease subunit [Notoacmeibacter sp. MSK16QG-6]MCP1198925.1 ABC transporter permease subunit [Notoacmeibacter sp. MSK16QG-6]
MLALAVIGLPVTAGLAGTVLPAFGFLPALGRETFSLEPFRELFAAPALGDSVRLSLVTGLAAALISLGLAGAFTAAATGTPAFERMRRLLAPLLAVPHAAAAFAFAFLIAPSGLILRLLSPWATGFERPPNVLVIGDPAGLSLIAGLVLKETPFLILLILAALPQMPTTRSRQLAASLGYGRMAGFVFLQWQPLYRQIRLGVLAVIAFSSSVIDVALILGPNLPAPLSVRLAQWMVDPDLSLRFMASAGAVLQLFVTMAAILCWIGLEWLGAVLLAGLRDRGLRFARDAIARAMAVGLPLATALLLILGILALFLWCCAGFWPFPDALPGNWTLRSWRSAWPRLDGPLATTMIAAIASTAIGMILVVLRLATRPSGRPPAALSRGVMWLPLLLPQVGFLFGLQLLAIRTGTDGTYGALILSHLIFVIPYLMIALQDGWAALDPRYERVATALGASPLRTFFAIRLPLMTNALLAAFAIGFAVSVGQYLTTVLIGAGRLPTLTTEAVALAAGDNRRIIAVYALLQTMPPLILFAIAAILPTLLWRNRRAMAA